MKQFIIADAVAGADRAVLSQADFHYLCRVRRMRPGDQCAVITPGGRSGHIIIDRVDLVGGQVVVRVCIDAASSGRGAQPQRIDTAPGVAPPPAQQAVEVNLIQSIPKGRKLDDVVRAATAIGVAAIVPVFSQYCVPSSDFASDAKARRLAALRDEAVQQSGSPVFTQILSPIKLSELATIYAERPGRGWYCHPGSAAAAAAADEMTADARPLWVAIGPEGGFGPGDLAVFAALGFEPLSFGQSILRTEVAGIYAIAYIRGTMAAKS